MANQFKSIEEMEAAMAAVTKLSDDLFYARIFERTDLQQAIFAENDDRFWDLAGVMEPELAEIPDISKYLDEKCRTSNDQESVFRFQMVLRDAFFAIGLLLGARLADPSGRTFEKLAEGWIVEKLTHGYYQHLQRLWAGRRRHETER